MMRSVLMALALMSVAPLSAGAADVTAIMLLYQRQEPGTAPYASRVLVTPAFMRMDDGNKDGDYLLFDRRQRVISSVTHEDRTVLVITARGVDMEPPVQLDLGAVRVDEGDLPAVAGKCPEHHRLTVNQRTCYDVVAVPDLLPDAVAARREFRQVLAGEHASILPTTPADVRDACDLATNTFAPVRHLDYGLPIQEADASSGLRQSLVDFDAEQVVDSALFELPEGYQRYGTPDVR